MSLLGIDIGTTGCKAVVFSERGEQLAKSYRDYEIISEKEGYAELDSIEVWYKIQATIKEVSLETKNDPIKALSLSSLGEALVPVSEEGNILGNSILGSDSRGTEFTELILNMFSHAEIFRITGNLPGTFYSMPKIAWIKKYQPDLYNNTHLFLTWADFVCYMLGGIPTANHSLAGRTLLFDIHASVWSEEILNTMKLDVHKFAPPKPSGTFLGFVKEDLAIQLHLGKDVAIISGGHDQCCAALGSGIKSNSRGAMYGLGTFICVVPVFPQMPEFYSMFENKLHIEHHVVQGSFISFIYNQSGGALIKWFKQTFSSRDQQTSERQENSFHSIFNEIPDNSTEIIVIPRFGATGPPDFITGREGSISGLSLFHTRGDILRAMLEGISFYLREYFEKREGPFSSIDFLIATGGGAVSDKWLQITSDILGIPIIRNTVTEASALGAAIIAGKGHRIFSSFDEAIDFMVHKEVTVVPDISKKEFYETKFGRYKITIDSLKNDIKLSGQSSEIQ